MTPPRTFELARRFGRSSCSSTVRVPQLAGFPDLVANVSDNTFLNMQYKETTCIEEGRLQFTAVRTLHESQVLVGRSQ